MSDKKAVVPSVVKSDLKFFGLAVASLCLQKEIRTSQRHKEILAFESFQRRERAKNTVLADRARIVAESLAAGRAA
jgi:hypothetical protein